MSVTRTITPTQQTNVTGTLLPISEARKLIFNDHVSHSTILRMAKKGEFPAIKLLGGKWYFTLEVAQDWLINKYRVAGWEISNATKGA